MPFRSGWFLPFAVFSICFTLYLFSMPRTVALEDDGLFMLAAWFNGIAHPPGYPLFTLIAHAFTQIPWGNVAMRVHAVSALFGALTCAVLWGIGRELGLGRGIATLAALMFGFSAVLWSQSIIAEVYSLNSFLFFLALWLALRLRNAETQRRHHWLSALLGLTYGLALSNHWPLATLAAPGILLILLPRLVPLARYLPAATLSLLTGLIPYVWLYIRSQQAPFISYYGPLHDMGDLLFTVSRAGYSDSSPSADWGDKLGYVAFFFRELARQFSVVAVPFLLIGVWRQFSRLGPEIVAGLLWIFFSNSILLILLLNFDHEPLFQSVFRVYPLIAYGVAALWVGLGLAETWRFVSPRLSGDLARRQTSILGALLILGGTFASNATANLRHDYQWTNRYAQQFFDAIQPNGVVFLDGDIETGVIGYFRYCEGWRSDIELYNTHGLVFGTRLFEPLSTDTNSWHALVNAFIKESERPVYYASSSISPPTGIADHWLLAQIQFDLEQSKTRLPDPTPWLSYLDYVVNSNIIPDHWTQFHRDTLLRAIVFHLMHRLRSAASTQATVPYRTVLEKVMAASPAAELAWAERRIRDYPEQEPERKELAARLRRLRNLPQSAFSTKKDYALPDYLLGMLRRQEHDETAREYFEASIQRWNHPNNPAKATISDRESGIP